MSLDILCFPVGLCHDRAVPCVVPCPYLPSHRAPGFAKREEEGWGSLSWREQVKSHRQRRLAGFSSWGGKRVRHDLVTKQQQLGGSSLCGLDRGGTRLACPLAWKFPESFLLCLVLW